MTTHGTPDGKVALVTGGSRGIGAAVALLTRACGRGGRPTRHARVRSGVSHRRPDSAGSPRAEEAHHGDLRADRPAAAPPHTGEAPSRVDVHARVEAVAPRASAGGAPIQETLL
ncbi:hypothetical protein [Streptomyces sp. AF1A]|uniref:hypothetical protein n=1 Tax=Streptomyces sp. AF1A TaxID=3394350 RepID=UPI0039BC93F9